MGDHRDPGDETPTVRVGRLGALISTTRHGDGTKTEYVTVRMREYTALRQSRARAVRAWRKRLELYFYQYGRVIRASAAADDLAARLAAVEAERDRLAAVVEAARKLAPGLSAGEWRFDLQEELVAALAALDAARPETEGAGE